MLTIGIDIGGTQTRVALVKDGKEIIKLETFETNPSFDLTIQKIGETVKSFNQPIIGVGACCPGPLDLKEGRILDPGNLPDWHGRYIEDALRQATGVSYVKIDNDANLAALGEYTNGEHAGANPLQFFTVSTGLGAGLILDGKVFHGFNGNAQEVANFTVSDDEVKYGLLVNGSIEAHCSGTGLAKQAFKIGLCSDAKTLFEKYHARNEDALKIVNNSIKRLGQLIANTISFIDPEVIVFSGSVALYNSWYVKEGFDYAQTLLTESMRNKTKYSISKLKGLGALYGAAQLVIK